MFKDKYEGGAASRPMSEEERLGRKRYDILAEKKQRFYSTQGASPDLTAEERDELRALSEKMRAWEHTSRTSREQAERQNALGEGGLKHSPFAGLGDTVKKSSKH